MNATDDKTIVKDYFNSTGFDRWRRIYGDGEVNKVQLDIRNGHQQTVDSVLGWLTADNNLPELSICDAGCGVGSLSIPLAQAGAKVYASDISEKMVEEGKERGLQNFRFPVRNYLNVKVVADITEFARFKIGVEFFGSLIEIAFNVFCR